MMFLVILAGSALAVESDVAAETEPPMESPEPEVYIEVEGVMDGEPVSVILSAANISPSYGVGTSNISIFGPIASKLPYGVHYVYWREGQYEYCLAYSADLVLTGSRFRAASATVVTYTTSTGSYQSQATFTTASDTNFSLDAGNYLVWSDLGDYPTLYERGGEDYAKTACIILASFGLYYLFHHLWADIRQRYLDR
jgi:hypothetical protein